MAPDHRLNTLIHVHRGRWVPRRAGGALLGVLLAASAAAAPGEHDNILQARAEVAEMVEESMDALESRVEVTGVVGWAVFTGDALPSQAADLGSGIGMAEDATGEAWFLRAEPEGCLADNRRYSLLFRDEDLFQAFRQGELEGADLERAAGKAKAAEARPVVAFSFRPLQQPALDPVDLSGCRFALHRDLQRALIGTPSRTESLVDDDHVDVDDN